MVFENNLPKILDCENTCESDDILLKELSQYVYVATILENHVKTKVTKNTESDALAIDFRFLSSCGTEKKNFTHIYPSGLKLWRETTLGQALIEVLDDYMSKNIITFQTAPLLLEIFDRTMTQQLIKNEVISKAKIKTGTLMQYKNLDGTWTIYVADLRIQLKRIQFYSPVTRIVATELATIHKAMQT